MLDELSKITKADLLKEIEYSRKFSNNNALPPVGLYRIYIDENDNIITLDHLGNIKECGNGGSVDIKIDFEIPLGQSEFRFKLFESYYNLLGMTITYVIKGNNNIFYQLGTLKYSVNNQDHESDYGIQNEIEIHFDRDEDGLYLKFDLDLAPYITSLQFKGIINNLIT